MPRLIISEKRLKERSATDIRVVSRLETNENDDLSPIRRIFKEFDLDGDGNLTLKEFRLGLSKFCGCELRNEDFKVIFGFIDVDDNRGLDVEEFEEFVMEGERMFDERGPPSAKASTKTPTTRKKSQDASEGNFEEELKRAEEAVNSMRQDYEQRQLLQGGGTSL